MIVKNWWGKSELIDGEVGDVGMLAQEFVAKLNIINLRRQFIECL